MGKRRVHKGRNLEILPGKEKSKMIDWNVVKIFWSTVIITISLWQFVFIVVATKLILKRKKV